MFSFPKIEKLTRDATLSHFFLMFGYKVFSIYFPLFLAIKGFSLPEVGYTYLLIYLPLAVFSPIIGFLNHKINPAFLMAAGIGGYGIYALGMILIENPFLFYSWQIILGISAALFFVSTRAILMGYPLENPNRAFGWFYSAPFYADALAPAVGAIIIWKFNFFGVFIFSLAIQFLTALFAFIRLKKPAQSLPDSGFSFRQLEENYQKVFQKIKNKAVLPFILTSLSVLILAGFYRPFFILFLKEDLLWSQNFILIFVSVLSFLFSLISFFIINNLGRLRSEKSILYGSVTTGIFSVLFGAMIPALNFLSVLFINLMRSAGSLICNAGRSGHVNQQLKEHPEEAGAVDTIFAPLGIALGALISGLIVGYLGYGLLFIVGGLFVLIVSFFSYLQKIKN